mgnify:CR=1 FL=1
MRKFYSFVLLMLLSMTLCGIVAVAQSVTVDNIVYELQYDGTAKLKNGKLATGNVVIPVEVEYEGKKYPVVAIGYEAFMKNTAITSVNIPTSVIKISDSAFYGCINLVSITGGAETMDNIGTNAFGDTPWCKNFPEEDGLKYWKGWIIGINLPDGFDELHIKEGTVGKVRYLGKLQGKTLYLPKSFGYFYPDDIRVEKFVVDKENPTFFSDDFGAVYKKNGKTSFYSYSGSKRIYVTGQMLHKAPYKSTAETFVVAEGTVCLDEEACYQGRFERIIVPEGCEYVLDNNFRYLSSCKYIELPSTLKYFSMYSPNGDPQMEIVLKAKEVPETDNDPFYRCGLITLYVPKESLEKYLANSNYNGKFKEIKAIPDNVTLKGDINGDGKVNAADVTTVYNYIANPEATGLTLDKVDVNGDGNVNATDITDLYNIIQME